ncbi:MAG: endonuclease/exonuclease/phosphatase family protein [Myxococcota bacterium]
MTPASGALVRLLVANVELGEHERAAAAGAALAEHRPDLVVLLEWDGANVDLAPLLDGGLAVVLSDPRPGPYGLAVLARPDSAAAAVLPTPIDGPCPMPWATVRWSPAPGRELGILVAHVPPPIPACGHTTRPSLRALGAIVHDGTLASRLGDHPIVVGDLNTPARSPRFRRLLADTGSSDAAFAGNTEYTFPSELPLLRLDHVLVPEGLAVHDAVTLPVPGSDHKAVMVTLSAPLGP